MYVCIYIYIYIHKKRPLTPQYIADTIAHGITLADARINSTLAMTRQDMTRDRSRSPRRDSTSNAQGERHKEQRDSNITIHVTPPNDGTVSLDIRTTRNFRTLKAARLTLGHVTNTTGYITHKGQPHLDTTSLGAAGIVSGGFPRWLIDKEPANPRPQSHDHHRGGLERNDVDISEETPGARQNVFEPTLFIHARLTGRTDIQVAPHTTVIAMLAYVATMVGVKQDDVAIQHSKCGSIGGFGPLVQDIPGIGEFDTLVVHRILTIQVNVIFRTGDQGTRTVATTLDTFDREARTDVRGTYIWTHLPLAPKDPSGKLPAPFSGNDISLGLRLH